MKNVKVLGGGCAKCEILAEETKKAAQAAGVEIQLEKITDFGQIMQMGVMKTPALVIDGHVKFSGKVLKAEELLPYFS
jgi:small redox-active disulfide protein 2